MSLYEIGTRRLYRENLQLLLEARSFALLWEHRHQLVAAAGRTGGDPMVQRQRAHVALAALGQTTALMQISSRLTHAMAWLMGQMAVENNEISASEAQKRFALERSPVCTDPNFASQSHGDPGIQDFLDRSLAFYRRLLVLEDQMRRAPPTPTRSTAPQLRLVREA